MEPKSQDDVELVQVFDTQQESEAMVVQGLLNSAGIESIISNLDAPQDVLPGVGGVVIRVNPDQADEARRLIAENQVNPDALPSDLDIAEDALSEDRLPEDGQNVA
jgi:hypothetical protein